MTDSSNRVSRARGSTLVAALLLAAASLLGACGGDSITGPQAESCGAGPYFTVLPAAASELAYVAIFGGVDAPGHTLPTAHGGLLVIDGNAGARCGISLKGADIVVKGNVGHMSCFMAQAGRLSSAATRATP